MSHCMQNDENGRSFSFCPPIWLDEIDSTSSYLKSLLVDREHARSGLTFVARRQTMGRGRMGAVWESAREGDITFSFYWEGVCAPTEAGSVSMACALGVRDFLTGMGVAACCKWPNDIMVGDGKICGILAEGEALGEGRFGLVVGIGVNVRRVDGRDDRFGRRTVAVEDFVEGELDPELLMRVLLPCIAEWMRKWEAGGFAALRGELAACLWGLGREVMARVPGGGRVTGVVAGLGESGELLLRTKSDEMTAVSSVSALEGWDLGL